MKRIAIVAITAAVLLGASDTAAAGTKEAFEKLKSQLSAIKRFEGADPTYSLARAMVVCRARSVRYYGELVSRLEQAVDSEIARAATEKDKQKLTDEIPSQIQALDVALAVEVVGCFAELGFNIAPVMDSATGKSAE